MDEVITQVIKNLYSKYDLKVFYKILKESTKLIYLKN